MKPWSPFPGRKRKRRMVAAACAVLLTTGMTAGTAQAGPPKPTPPGTVRSPIASGAAPAGKTGVFDSRREAGTQQALRQRGAARAAVAAPALKSFRAGLGVEGVVDLDPLTGTPRVVGRLDGFLTDPSAAAPAAIATGYLNRYPEVFGLSAADVSRLSLRRDYVDIAGTHHLSFVQSVGGVPLFGNGVQAHVTKDGRLIQINGSPVAGLPTSLPAVKLTPDAARRAALTNIAAPVRDAKATTAADAVSTTVFSDGDRAQRVVFQSPGGPRPAWQTITRGAKNELFLEVVDGQDGRTLYRHSLTEHEAADASGLAWDYYPGAPKGGTQKRRDFTEAGWLPAGSQTLDGNTAHVFLDVNVNLKVDPGEEVPSGAKGRFDYPFTDFTAQTGAAGFCSSTYPCSWNSAVAGSWRTNADQDGTQVFYYLGNFHDHLAAFPIGFTRAAGNFEKVDGDAIFAAADLGADDPRGFFVDNAFMSTPPDGESPLMGMFLFHARPDVWADDPFLAGNAGDEADIVYHEYTHGLSNRLVVDAQGNSTLDSEQSGAMGEAWSDWYAEDYLVDKGFVKDTAAAGDVRVGVYVSHGRDLIRTQPLDCPVGSTDAKCHGGDGAGPGGYTYGDYGRIIGFPEVHADGEIWGETLWDLRKALGTTLTESLVTRAMELSPASPSFLDMRNSILQADTVVNGGQAHKKIWQVFAQRGMGFFAATLDGDDNDPVEDFNTPPPAGTPTGSLTGTITDQDTGAPAAGVTVEFAGHTSGFAGDYVGVTGADGTYTISGILPGTYPEVRARGGVYEPQIRTISIASRTNVVNWVMRHDWAALSGGSAVTAFDGDPWPTCGPDLMLDMDQSTGVSWFTAFNPDGTLKPITTVVKLPAAVNINGIAINPTGTCGDDGSSSVGGYKVETSVDGTTWTDASAGTFHVADQNRMNSLPLAPASTAGVRYVRYTILSTQVAESGGTCPSFDFSGCFFVDTVELAVYGMPG